jgi:hypothetical protein
MLSDPLLDLVCNVFLINFLSYLGYVVETVEVIPLRVKPSLFKAV